MSNKDTKAQLAASAEAAEMNFSTDNVLDGGCAECACEIILNYVYDDGEPVPNAAFVLEDSNGKLIDGKTDKKGLCKIENMGCGPFEVLLEEGDDDFDPTKTVKNNPVMQSNPMYSAIAGEYFTLFVMLRDKGYLEYDPDDSDDDEVDVDRSSLITVVARDDKDAYHRFWQLNRRINRGPKDLKVAVNKIHNAVAAEVASQEGGSNIAIMLLCEVVIGCIPLVGQAVDVYCLGDWCWRSYKDPGLLNDNWHKAEGLLNIVALVPGLGDALKVIGKAVIKALKDGGKVAIQTAIKVIRSLSDGNIVKFLAKFRSLLSDVVSETKGMLAKMAVSLRKSQADARKSWFSKHLDDDFAGIIDALDTIAAGIEAIASFVSDKIDGFIPEIITRATGTPVAKGSENPVLIINAGVEQPEYDSGGSTFDPITGLSRSRKKNQLCKTNKCKGEGEPVDMATGYVFEERSDFELPGPLELVHSRYYRSAGERYSGLLGSLWRSNWDICLELTDNLVRFTDDKYGEAWFDIPKEGEFTVADTRPEWRLTRYQGALELHHLDGQCYRFEHALGTQLLLTRIRDSHGNAHNFLYERGILRWVVLSDERLIQVETRHRRITRMTLMTPDRQPIRELVRFEYNKQGQMTRCRADAGRNFDYEYGTQGRMLRWADLNKTWVEHDYDDQGRAISTRCSDGYWHDQIRYDDDQNIVYYKNALEGVLAYHHDERNNIIRIVDPLGHATEQEWDGNNLTAVINPLGEKTAYSYNDRGQVTEVVQPDGSSESYEYDDQGLPVSYTNPLGAAWQYSFDAQRNLRSLTDPLGNQWRYDYNPQGRLIRETSPEGNTTQLDWNQACQLMQVQTNQQLPVSFRYDAQGRISQRISHQEEGTPDLIRRWFYHDSSPRPARIQWEDGTESQFEYDIEGNLIRTTNPRGDSQHYQYGAFDKLLQSTDPLG
ncbi:DUF6531 domain-containing protein, partial [Oceanospirillum beijerinckii]|uniref:DUF6531 domain-containing protein n=1 Tax=Oceanospirillum beijerinckii TaxID=64976 RepID=UPI0004859424